jgi:hypothetical protein
MQERLLEVRGAASVGALDEKITHLLATLQYLAGSIDSGKIYVQIDKMLQKLGEEVNVIERDILNSRFQALQPEVAPEAPTDVPYLKAAETKLSDCFNKLKGIAGVVQALQKNPGKTPAAVEKSKALVAYVK